MISAPITPGWGSVLSRFQIQESGEVQVPILRRGNWTSQPLSEVTPGLNRSIGEIVAATAALPVGAQNDAWVVDNVASDAAQTAVRFRRDANVRNASPHITLWAPHNLGDANVPTRLRLELVGHTPYQTLESPFRTLHQVRTRDFMVVGDILRYAGAEVLFKPLDILPQLGISAERLQSPASLELAENAGLYGLGIYADHQSTERTLRIQPFRYLSGPAETAPWLLMVALWLNDGGTGAGVSPNVPDNLKTLLKRVEKHLGRITPVDGR